MKKKTTKSPATEDVAQKVAEMFDMEWPHVSQVPNFHWRHTASKIPTRFDVGYIIGPSGSGKTLLLKSRFGGPTPPCRWRRGVPVANHFPTAEEAVDRLLAAGIGSIPTMLQPYETLSAGEAYRADLACAMSNGAVFDEFTSFLDRVTAASVSAGIGKWIRAARFKNVVFAGLHTDVLPFLQPDWVFFTESGRLLLRESGQIPAMFKLTFNLDFKPAHVLDRYDPPASKKKKQPVDDNQESAAWSEESEISPSTRDLIAPVSFCALVPDRQAEVEVTLRRAPLASWHLFAKHHYLDHKIVPHARCFVGFVGGIPAVFIAISTTGGTQAIVKKALTIHRLVVLPRFQGLGIGARVMEIMGDLVARADARLFISTANPKLGRYLDRSTKWTPTAGNRKLMSKSGGALSGKNANLKNRLMYRYEYTGDAKRPTKKTPAKPRK